MAQKKEEQAQTPDVMAAVEEKIAQMLAEAEKKANEIIKAAEQKVQAPKGTAPEDIQKINDEMEEYVMVKLFKDSGKYSDDVFAAINGEGCNIPRGIPVKIKRKFLTVLEQSDLQDAKTAQFMEAESQKFEAESKARNL